jgi:hypothetical protein
VEEGEGDRYERVYEREREEGLLTAGVPYVARTSHMRTYPGEKSLNAAE